MLGLDAQTGLLGKGGVRAEIEERCHLKQELTVNCSRLQYIICMILVFVLH